MKIAMTRYFVPPNYKQQVHLQFTQLTQESLSVDEYTKKFFSLATRSEFPWNEDVMISMYRKWLNLQISSGLAACRLYTMVDADQVAAQIEEEVTKKTSMKFTTTSYAKNDRTAIDLSKEGMSIHSQPATILMGHIGYQCPIKKNLHVGFAQEKEAAEQESDLAGNSSDFGVYVADDLADKEDAIT
ncbi:unnamed protein product [Dovyalis caffra]|uniref:Retrotransposon gag domain-containing protein n=1 Tax=Dovyalis caffra TaxID=77055 RepID=A0AAV1RGE9_9ROSI|nr:unnamed protein product [Dovyalis caffra]